MVSEWAMEAIMTSKNKIQTYRNAHKHARRFQNHQKVERDENKDKDKERKIERG